MMTKQVFVGIAIAASIALVGTAGAGESLSARAEYMAAQERIEADFRAARERCNSLSGHAQDVCVAEARAKQRIERAAAEARVKDTPRARYDARIARAEAEYQVAKERCGGRTGEAKEACLREAQAVEERAKADASADWRAAEARK